MTALNETDGKWSWWRAAKTCLSPTAMTWFQLAMAAIMTATFWQVGNHTISHEYVRNVFYVGMGLYLLAAVWLLGDEPVAEHGLWKTCAVIALPFLLVVLAPSYGVTLLAMIAGILFARAYIGVERSRGYLGLETGPLS